MTAETWGDFEVHMDKILGEGGMGTVYRGRQVSLDRPVAIKVLSRKLSRKTKFIKRFQREGMVMGRLDDPHIVQVFGAGEHEGRYYIAMELLEGRTLKEELERNREFDLNEVLDIGIAVSMAMAAAWEHQIVHRDIKPDNIFLVEDDHVKVMDYGLAREPSMDLTDTGTVLGTYRYMAVEQMRGDECDIRSDIFSLGAVLYELVTDRVPNDGDNPTEIFKKRSEKNPPSPRRYNPSVPEPLENVILTCLERHPDHRYQHPKALIKRLKNIKSDADEFVDTILDRTIYRRGGAGRGSGFFSRPIRVALLVVLVVLAGYLGWQNKDWIGARIGVVSASGKQEQTVEAEKGPEEAESASNQQTVQRNGNGTEGGEETNANASSSGGKTDASKRDREKTANEEGNSVKEQVRLARRAMSNGEWKQAETFFQRALKQREESGSSGEVDVDQLKKDLRTARYNRFTSVAQREEDRENLKLALDAWQKARDVQATDTAKTKIRQLKVKIKERRWKDARASKEWDVAETVARELTELQPNEDLHKKHAAFAGAMRKAYEAKQDGNWVQALDLLSKWEEQPEAAALIKRVKEARKKEQERKARLREEQLKTLKDKTESAFRKGNWETLLHHIDSIKALNGMNDQLRTMEALAKMGTKTPEEMVFVPGGQVPIGGDAEMSGPRHEVEIEPFYLERTEVTVGEYREFLNALDGHENCYPNEPEGKDHVPDHWEDQLQQGTNQPVTGVDWFDAYAYASWDGKRLPSEKEWEAAAGYDRTKQERHTYPWGNTYKPSLTVQDPGSLQSVDALSNEGASPSGALGMAGNAGEWTASWFYAYPGGNSNPLTGKKNRIVRGMPSTTSPELTARVFVRDWHFPDFRHPALGFRCAEDAGASSED